MSLVAPPDDRAVREGCRALEGLAGVTISGDLVWFQNKHSWALPIRMHVQSGGADRVPADTEWYVVIDARYPFGKIEVYPARFGGLVETFQHQDRNEDEKENVPWRQGDICVRAPGFVHGRHGGDPDPLGQAQRLSWYVGRAHEWLQDAAAGTLAREGEPFELPQFNPVDLTIGFCEDTVSFSAWRASRAQFGQVELVPLGEGKGFVVREFTDPSGTTIVAPAWGTLVREHRDPIVGGWVRLNSVPVAPPYDTPVDWAGLLSLLVAQGIDPDVSIRKVLQPLRGLTTGILLIGFPIPRRIGEGPSFMHWQPIRLPQLASGTMHQGGFSGTERGHWARDSLVLKSSRHRLQWLNGENWGAEFLQMRGQVSASLAACRVTLVGAGALGSAVGELLVRGGVCDLLVVDPESFAAGNLVRHTLDLADVGHPKATRLAARLNRLSPFARVTGAQRHSGTERQAIPAAAGRRLVVDSTGSDDVLQQLCSGSAEPGSCLVSMSMSLGCKRLYLLTIPGMSAPFDTFKDTMQPWLQRDRDEHPHLRLGRGGPGCWHPVFPGRPDQVWIHAAAAIRELERAAGGTETSSLFRVLEVDKDHDGSMKFGQAVSRNV